MSSCPSDDDLRQFVSGVSSRAIDQHLLTCRDCRSRADRLSDEDTLRGWAGSLAAGRANRPGDVELGRLVEALCRQGRESTRTSPPEDAEAADATTLFGPADEPGDLGTLGPYAIETELGRGGMGVVYRARDRRMGRVVALKVLVTGPTNVRARQRFMHEIRAAARVEHDHVVRLYGTSDPDEKAPYFVMEYVAGPTLAEKIRTRRRLDPRDAALIIAQAADGLAAAHAAGLIHRDVKPSNILLDPVTGRAKVGDFGLARLPAETSLLTHDGSVAGTPAYLSPEQATGDAKAGERVDVYALGVTLYECLAGEPPFRGTPHLVVQQVLHDEPRPPRALNDAVPRDLETVCLKAMAKEPGQRYANATELAADLRRWLDGRPIRARRVSPVGRLVRLCRRRPFAATLALSLASVLLASSITVLVLWARAEANATRARKYLAEAERNYRAARDAVDALYVKLYLSGALNQPGLESARGAVVRDILRYYNDFLRWRGNDPSLRDDAAEASFRVGLMTTEVGDKRDALAALQQARGLLEAVTHDKPGDLASRRNLAQCHDQIGFMFQQLGNTPEAIKAHRLACDVYRNLAEAAPKDPLWRRLAGHALGNLANTSFLGNRHEEAARAYRQAREQFEALLRLDPANPGYRSDLALTLNNMSMTLKTPEERLACLQEALILREALAAEIPRDSYPRRNLARTRYNMAHAYKDLGRRDEALRFLDEACDGLRQVIREVPNHQGYRDELATACVDRANLLLVLGRPDDAVVSATEGRSLLDGAVRADPGNVHFREHLCDAHLAAARAHEALDHLDEAMRARQARLALLQRIADDRPADAQAQSAAAAEAKVVDSLNSRLGQQPKTVKSSIE